MKKLKAINIANTLIKIYFFFAFPAAWATGFAGLKYLCEQIHSGKPIELKAFLVAFIALTAFTVVFGRFFCGRACAFGTYGDVLHYLARLVAKKAGRKLPEANGKAFMMMRYVKYIVLLAVCFLCISGYGSVVSGASPWTAFSHLRTGKIETGSTLDIVGIVLFAVISVCMFFCERFFCRFLCPFGAVFSLLPVLPFSVVSRDKCKCLKGCRACKSVCPAKIDLPYRSPGRRRRVELSDAEEMYALRSGECFMCGRCTNICPKQSAGCSTMKSGTKGIAIDVIKASILAVILWFVI